MPIYLYKCEKCGRREEILQKIDDSRQIKCPDCGIMMLNIIGNINFSFKGQGYHTTDYKKKK